ncbi:MAG: SAP domain-containing protein [Gammaproteobacteria bacterium]|nr:SAP domain-containing protein [Gammaproteobacteria bacterium]
MNMQEIRTIARKTGVKAGKQRKVTLIKNIQNKEGNFGCFATAYQGSCDQGGCLWRKDCLPLSQKSMSA